MTPASRQTHASEDSIQTVMQSGVNDHTVVQEADPAGGEMARPEEIQHSRPLRFEA